MTDTASDVDNGSTDPGADDESTPTVGEAVGALLTKIRSRRRRFSRAKNLLKDLDGKEPDAADFEAWLEARSGLDGFELGVEEVDELRESVVERLDKVLERLRIKARMKFLTKLEMLADRRDLEVEKISENPLVLYLEPLTFAIDFDEGGVEMAYGHEVIDELPIDAGAVIDAHDEAVQWFDDELVASAEFFELLQGAYRMVVAADGSEPGDRIDLVDVLVPLSMLRVDRSRLRSRGPEAMEPFSRPLLARQLAELRRDGMLERDGVRLDLGAATGGSPRDKADVLYIPVESTGGQYYGSLRFE